MSYEEKRRPRPITFKKYVMIAPRKEGFMVMHRIVTVFWEYVHDDAVIAFPKARLTWTCRGRWQGSPGRYTKKGTSANN